MILIHKNLSLDEIERIIVGREQVALADEVRREVEQCYTFLAEFAREKVIYGINTGFGPMAQWRIEDDKLTQLQYNIIRSHSTGAGEPLEPMAVRGAMLARLMTFVQAHSGVHVEVIDLLVELLNREIYPVVPEHGSVGASGDLVQLSHIALALIGEGEVFYRGERMKTAEVFAEEGIEPLKMYLREGLAATNGTAVMTGLGLKNLLSARHLMAWSLTASVLMNEIAQSYDDLMSEVLNGLKQHEGQRVVAARMREIATGSRRLLSREEELYHAHEEAIFEHKVQPYYSLRCVPQILGPVWDEMQSVERVLVGELNSVDDNPIVDPANRTVIHGGNFHGDYVSFAMDKLKIALTKLTMLAERQMNYLFHDRINGILPPFLNMGTLGLNYGMQACQFTATSTTAECQTLSMPNYVHTIPNNNDNQDIVSMGTNSALLCKRVIDNAYQVMAIHMIALRQATDILKKADMLAPATKAMYDKVNAIIPAFVDDTPFYDEIAKVEEMLRN